MKRVDYYLIPENDLKAKFRFACRLVSKAFDSKKQVYIHTSSDADAHQIDDLLWTFHDISFIPHDLVGTDLTPPIQIGFGNKPENQREILLNLSDEVPYFADQFERTLEIVHEDETYKAKSRINFKRYKEMGFEIETHDLRK